MAYLAYDAGVGSLARIIAAWEPPAGRYFRRIDVFTYMNGDVCGQVLIADADGRQAEIARVVLQSMSAMSPEEVYAALDGSLRAEDRFPHVRCKV